MANRFWNPSADANWADANVWATTFNGDPTGVATPTSADDCFFTATNSHKCTIGATANCNNLYFDNADNGGYGDYVGTLAGSSFLNVYGNLVMSSGMSVSFSGYLYFKATSGSYNIDTKGISLACAVFEIGVTTQNATYTLQSNLVLTNFQSAITLSSGSFITNGKTLTIPALTCNDAYTKSLDISNSNIEINYVGFMINALNIDATTTFTSTNSTIKFTDTTNGNITFAGGSKTYNNIYFSRGASTGNITITGSNTFNDFKDDGTAAHSILFTKSTTNNIATWNVNGAGGGVRTILDTADGAGTFTLHGTGTTLSCDWLDIRRSTVDASPKWYAGANSLNTASNTNWIFTAGPTIYTMVTAPASFSYTPQSSGDPVTRYMTTAKATFTLTGMASGFQTIRKMITAPASYVLTGMSAGFHKAYVMVTAPATFILTGMSVNMSIRRLIRPVINLINIIKPKLK